MGESTLTVTEMREMPLELFNMQWHKLYVLFIVPSGINFKKRKLSVSSKPIQRSKHRFINLSELRCHLQEML